MRREELAHTLRAASQVTDDKDVLVVGSQAILGSFDEDELPAEAVKSDEVDIAFRLAGDRSKADAVTGAIGEMSQFHATHGYYVDGISIELIVLPDGWEDRLVAWDLKSSAPADPRFLEPHDIAVAKLAARRRKDVEFVSALLRAGLLDAGVVRERAQMLSGKWADRAPGIIAWIDGWSG